MLRNSILVFLVLQGIIAYLVALCGAKPHTEYHERHEHNLTTVNSNGKSTSHWERSVKHGTDKSGIWREYHIKKEGGTPQHKQKDDHQETFEDAITRMEKEFQDRNDDPCNKYYPKQPDFQSRGHRISETRCLEMIWAIKKNEEIEKRSNKCQGSESMTQYIVGGKTPYRGEYPHMGAVGWPTEDGEYVFLCGSTLISHKFLLTAAHCYKVPEGTEKVTSDTPTIVRLGVRNIMRDNRSVDREIESFIRHPDYKYPKRYNDIALIKLKESVKYGDNIRPACLWNRFKLKNRRTAAVSGWGVTDPALDSFKTSDELRVAGIDIIPSDKCDDMLAMKRNDNWWRVKNHQLCATKVNGTADACQGDSGGPLQVKMSANTKKKTVYSVIGVTSVGFGNGCARSLFPSIYTRVSSFIDWVEQEIWGDQGNTVRQKYHKKPASHRRH